MKVVILAGGLGTRLSEYTHRIPKPLVEVGGKPIILHIIEIYQKFNFNEFIIATGYKGNLFEEYFKKNGKLLDSSNGAQSFDLNGSKVSLIETGLNTLTGGRLKRLTPYLENQTFLLTYGDGLSNVNITNLIEFHKRNQATVTVTAVHPIARFGELELTNDSMVSSFKEKPLLQKGWINGGFFVMESSFLNLIQGDDTILEKEPLEDIAAKGKMFAFKHEGFWYCMDTQRDKTYLDNQALKELPWLQD